MLITALLVGAVIGSGAPEPVTLSRVFVKGERLQYSVKATLKTEQRQPPLDTFLPFEMGFEYAFNTEATTLKTDGIVQLIYKRPTMTEIEGETYNRDEQRTTIKSNLNFKLDVSPINEILQTLDLNKETKPAKKKKTPGVVRSYGLEAGGSQKAISLRTFTDDIYRLALCVGGLDTALDFNPKLPYDAVSPGDTWKRTVGYSPQRLAGKSGKSAVQRLDYVYSYKGLVDSDGAKVHRVTADLKLDTDAAEFINQMLDMKPSESGLKSLKLKLNVTIDFDLDPKSFLTKKAVARSDGSVDLEATILDDDRPLVEIKLKGETIMRLVSRTAP